MALGGNFGGVVATIVKSLVIEDPTAAEDISFSQLNDVAQGTTPSVTWNLRHAATRNEGSPNNLFSSNRVTTSESGAETTTFDDATIPAGSWVWFISSAQSGTVDELTLTIRYTED